MYPWMIEDPRPHNSVCGGRTTLTQFPCIVVTRKESTQIWIILVSHGKMQNGATWYSSRWIIVARTIYRSPCMYYLGTTKSSGKYIMRKKGMLKTSFWKVESGNQHTHLKKRGKKKPLGKLLLQPKMHNLRHSALRHCSKQDSGTMLVSKLHDH